MMNAIAAWAGVDLSAVGVTVTSGSVIVDVRIQTPTALATSVQSAMASATSSPSSATAMLANVTGFSLVVLAVVTPPTIASIAPPPPSPPRPAIFGALNGASSTDKGQGALNTNTILVIGVLTAILGLLCCLAMVCWWMRRRDAELLSKDVGLRKTSANTVAELELHQQQPLACSVTVAAPSIPSGSGGSDGGGGGGGGGVGIEMSGRFDRHSSETERSPRADGVEGGARPAMAGGVIGASGSATIRTRTMAERSRMQQDKVRQQQEARRANPPKAKLAMLLSPSKLPSPARLPSPAKVKATSSSMIDSNLVRWSDLKLLDPIGAGSFGEVRVAVYNSTRCAIKSLRAATAAGALEELLQEFELTIRLHHPNVLLTMGIAHNSTDGRTGILMELMPASLLDLLHHHRQREQLATWEASLVLIALDVAKGMTYLHAKGVVHHDLKPGNVLLAEHWVAKVADFGTALSKYHFAGEAEGPLGTPPYMAPEAIALTSSAKEKPTDVWSFGCLLAHMGTRSMPYSHVQLPAGTPPMDAARALVAIIVEGQVTPLDQLRNARSCPPGILALATRCVRTEPAQRLEFPLIVEDLERLQGSVRASRPWTRLRRADIRLTDAGTTRASVDVAGYVATDVATNPLAFSSPGPALAGFEIEMAQFEESAPSTSKQTHALTGPALARNEAMATLGSTLGATFGAMTLAPGTEEPNPSSPVIPKIFGMFSPKPAEERSFRQYV